MGLLDFFSGKKKVEKPEESRLFKTFFDQGRIEYESKDYHNAIEYFDKAISEAEKTKVNLEKALVFKARSLDGLQRFNESQQLFDRAFELKPEDSFTWYMRGLSFMEQGLIDKALKYFEKSFEINPFFEEPMLTAAAYYGKVGQYDRQAECYQKILQNNPDSKRAGQLLQSLLDDRKKQFNRQWLGGITKGMKIRDGEDLKDSAQ
jgi:tetratricopeptide (TPR) repeat protein